MSVDWPSFLMGLAFGIVAGAAILYGYAYAISTLPDGTDDVPWRPEQ